MNVVKSVSNLFCILLVRFFCQVLCTAYHFHLREIMLKTILCIQRLGNFEEDPFPFQHGSGIKRVSRNGFTQSVVEKLQRSVQNSPNTFRMNWDANCEPSLVHRHWAHWGYIQTNRGVKNTKSSCSLEWWTQSIGATGQPKQRVLGKKSRIIQGRTWTMLNFCCIIWQDSLLANRKHGSAEFLLQ